MNQTIQGAVKAIIDNRDLNTLGEFFDWLGEQDDNNRRDQLHALRLAFGSLLTNNGNIKYRWEEFCRQLSGIFWFDLYTFGELKAALLAKFAEQEVREQTPPTSSAHPRPWEQGLLVPVPEPDTPAYTGIAEGSVTCTACGTLHPVGPCPNVHCPSYAAEFFPERTPDHGQKPPCDWM